MSHSVLCGDLAHQYEEDDEWIVEGFRTAEAAREFARRFVRDQIEGLRVEYADPQELKAAYLSFGEYAETPGFDLQGLVWREQKLYVGDRRKGSNGFYPVHELGLTGTCTLQLTGKTIDLPQPPVGLQAANPRSGPERL